MIGLAWLALAMDVHWQQLHATQALPLRTAMLLRTLGIAALVLSLLLCLRADHASIAALVRVMSLAAAALAIAFTLCFRPRWLAPLLGICRRIR